MDEKTVSTSLVKAEIASAPWKVVAVSSSTVACKEEVILAVGRGSTLLVKALVDDTDAKMRAAAIFMVL